MQQTAKNRLSAKISALLVAILTLSSLPLANIAKAIPVTELSLQAPTVVVEEGAGGTLLFSLNRKLNSPTVISYEITSIADPAEAGVDFSLPNLTGTTGTITIPANTLSFAVPLTVNDDTVFEGNENIEISITDQTNSSSRVNYTGANPVHIILADNDSTTPPALPYVSLDTEFRATPENEQNISFNIFLSQTSTSDVTFHWTTDDWNVGMPGATSNILDANDPTNDYTSNPFGFGIDNVATIPAGQSSISLNFTVNDDALDEQNEEIVLSLYDFQNSQQGVIIRTTHKILDNDTALANFAAIDPTDPFTVNEEDTSALFQAQINLTNKSDRDVTVLVEADTALSTATPGTDWELITPSVTIPAGEMTGTASIQLIDDSDTEDSEEIVIRLRSSGINNIIGDNATYTFIINPSDGFVAPTPVTEPAPSSGYGTAIPQSTASVGGVPAGSVVVTPAVTTPAPTPAPVTSVESTPVASGQVLGEQINVLHELIAKLKYGSTSDEVKQLQTELQKLGFFPAKMNTTRYYGVITKAAVQRYLDTKATEISLHDLATMLKFGQRGAAVKKLQSELKTGGFFPMNQTATGYYGNLTKQAVANYLAK